MSREGKELYEAFQELVLELDPQEVLRIWGLLGYHLVHTAEPERRRLLHQQLIAYLQRMPVGDEQ
jgi:hypothetical protein